MRTILAVQVVYALHEGIVTRIFFVKQRKLLGVFGYNSRNHHARFFVLNTIFIDALKSFEGVLANGQTRLRDKRHRNEYAIAVLWQIGHKRIAAYKYIDRMTIAALLA